MNEDKYISKSIVIKFLNDSDLISDVNIMGGQKTISADGIPSVPINTQGTIQTHEIISEESTN